MSPNTYDVDICKLHGIIGFTCVVYIIFLGWFFFSSLFPTVLFSGPVETLLAYLPHFVSSWMDC